MALRYRAMAALAKGSTMAAFALWVFGVTGWQAWHGTLPQAVTMGAVGFTALAANAASFALLWRHRGGDANTRSAWICTRNDVLGNLAVLLAALGVFGTGTAVGLMYRWRRSWRLWRCKARSLLFGKLGSSYEPQGNQSQFSLSNPPPKPGYADRAWFK
jgi:Co/Zn/Cd efflux system component